ncbi:MAG TPA: Wzz/FepE/Etk N-terminal domain-containing protein, partial [Micromonospora sp.]
MDLLDLLKLMFRRWYVTAPVIVVTLGAALALGSSIQPEYKTSAAILLVPPTTSAAAPTPGTSPQPGNPWLRVGENAMAQAVQISVSAHESRIRVQAAGGNPDYEIGLVNRSSIVTVDVTAESKEQ